MIQQLLVVDDDEDIREMIAKYMRNQGFAVHLAVTGADVQAQIQRHRIDLVLLDIMLGDDSGLAICNQLRRENNVPIILISALAGDQDRLSGYEVGADDYIAKPFNPELLLARVRAVLTRTKRATSLTHRRRFQRYQFGDWEFHSDKRALIGRDGVERSLSQREATLLGVFLANARVPLTREEIADTLDAEDVSLSESRAIDVAIGRLRSKIEADSKSPQLLQTVRGHGYALMANVTILDQE